MSTNKRLLTIIARHLPTVNDVIPRGPQSQALHGHASEFALNPQPLPPGVVGATVAAEFIRYVWLANRFGQDPGLMLSELEDWCPTVPLKIWKLPPWLLLVWPPDPDPEPYWFIDFHLGFASRLAMVSSEDEQSAIRAVLDSAMERSMLVIQ